MTAKRISIKDTGCKSGGCASKVVELTSGDLLPVLETGLRNERSNLSGRQKSAEGIVAARRSSEGLNGRERQVSGATHEREAAEKPARAGLRGGR